MYIEMQTVRVHPNISVYKQRRTYIIYVQPSTVQHKQLYSYSYLYYSKNFTKGSKYLMDKYLNLFSPVRFVKLFSSSLNNYRSFVWQVIDSSGCNHSLHSRFTGYQANMKFNGFREYRGLQGALENTCYQGVLE